MSVASERAKFSKEHIYITKISVPRCTLSYGVGSCQAGTHEVSVDIVTVDDFAIGATITGDTSGATGTITAIAGSSPSYTFTYTKTSGFDFVNDETLTASGGSSGIATVDGASTVTDTDNKCYNTLATCQDLANYDDEISTGNQTISVNATSGTFTRSAGSYVTDGFEEGQIITSAGFTNEGNNSQFKIDSVTATVITVTNNYGLVTETGGGDEVITTKNLFDYRFCENRSPHPQNLSGVYPCINSINIAPAKINPQGGIGGRASVSISFNDFPTYDAGGEDPYLSDRTYDPYSFGTFWTRWRKRNATYDNYAIEILSGYIVDGVYDESNFESRMYVMGSMTATRGSASITARDPLQLVSNKKSLAPAPSNGTLNASINNSVTSATLTPTGIGNEEYPSSGFVKIRDEIMSFTRSGDVLTITRAQKNTVADSHDAGDTVQLCLDYSGGDTVDLIQSDLLINYANISPIYIDSPQWNSEVTTYLSQTPNGFVSDPTPVKDLVAELCEQWPHKLYWNDRASKIQLEALKAPPSSANPLSMEENIIADSFTVRDRNDLQISTILVRYAQYNPAKKLDEKDNFEISYARQNNDAITRYQSNETKVIYSRWIPSGGGAAARQLAALIGRRFGITPRECSFALSDKDGALWIAEKRAINHRDIVDQNGYPEDTIFEMTSAKEGNSYEYTALEHNFDVELDEDEGGGDPDVDLVLIELDDQNITLRTLYDANFSTPDASTKAKFVVSSGVIIGSSSVSTEAVNTGSWPAGATVTLQVNSGAFIVGKGGDGDTISGSGGEAGGDALHLAYDLTLVNNGVIGGGGGGGGYGFTIGTTGNINVTGAGGAGNDVGAAPSGTSWTGSPTPSLEKYPQDGALESGGDRGIIRVNDGGLISANGGFGGDLGQAGTAGSGLDGSSSGGAAGAAIDKNGYTLTKTVAGDIRGAELA